jgi:hypothetical protein
MGSEDLILFNRGRCCKLGFEPAHAFAVQCRLNDEVYDMPSTAYTVARGEVDLVVYVEALDERVVVVGGVIADEAVELRCNFEAFEESEDNSCLRSACMIAVEVAKRKEYIALLVLRVCSR